MTFDPDFGKEGFARDLFRLRFREMRIDQATFAERFGLTFGNVKDLEQARRKPIAAVRVLVAAIEMDPELIERAAREAEKRWPAEGRGGVAAIIGPQCARACMLRRRSRSRTSTCARACM